MDHYVTRYDDDTITVEVSSVQFDSPSRQAAELAVARLASVAAELGLVLVALLLLCAGHIARAVARPLLYAGDRVRQSSRLLGGG